jgi:hypothetical protein
VSFVAATLAALATVALGAGTARAAFVQRGQFGSFGSAPGQFGSYAPAGVAVDQSTGDVYLADTLANRVERFDPEGNFISQFGEPGTGAGQFENTGGVAVDQASGDVYVFDEGGARVERFDSQGRFLAAWGWGVADGAAASEVCTAGCGAGIQGSGAGQFAGGLGSLANVIVVDAGNVYVADPGNGRVERFDSAGHFISQITTNLSSPEGLAVDSAHNLYVADSGSGAVEKFTPSGSFLASIGEGTSPSAVATDQAGDLFVYANDIGPHIREYDTAGAQVDDFGSGILAAAFLVKPGLAFAPNAGVLYVADQSNSRAVIFGPAIAVPDVTTSVASNVQATTATLNATVNPNGAQITSCQFDYGTTASYGQSAPCAQEPGSGNAAVPVSADIASLQPNTTYHFRLRAANAGFLSTRTGQDQTFTTPGPPSIASESATDVTSTEAILRTQVNPGQLDTTYHFEYGTTTAYGTSVPTPDGDVGSGGTDQPASTPISGLQPGTTYHFRVLAHNAQGTTTGADHTFTTFAPPEPGLPDGRAYELVTSVDKLGGTIGQEGKLGSGSGVSFDGQHVIYTSDNAFGNPPNGLAGEYEATRTAGGWTTTPATLPPGTDHPSVGNVPPALNGVTPDFSTLFFDVGNAIDPNDQNSSEDVYAFHVPDRSTTWVSQNGTVATAHVASIYVGSSADANHVLFDTPQQLTADDSGQVAGQALYDRTGGRTVLVGVNSDGSLTSACGATAGDVRVGFGGTLEHILPERSNAVSSDGSRIFFESPDPQGSGDPSCSAAQGGTQPVELYVRVNASTTTEISLSQKTGAVGTPAAHGATFQGATRDGSTVFFASQDQLTDDPAAASGGLYRYDLGAGVLTLIAPSVQEPLADSIGDPMISSDASHVYFTGSVPGNGPAGNNLYVWSSGQISFISPAPAPQTHGPSGPEARLSGDGLTLTFTAANNLTGFDSEGFYEVYVYHAATGTLSCVSCDPNEGRPAGNATFFGDGSFPSSLVSQNVSNDGGRVFFASPDRLLPQATNGLYNVYEYEVGTLHLLDDGSAPFQSWLVGASADGRDVVFATDASLLPQDRDGGQADLYDARIGGGFPELTPPAPCHGEACKPPPSAPPVDETPGSATFNGPGNQTASDTAAKSLTRSQRLARALRACRRKPRRERPACRRRAQIRYGRAATNPRRASTRSKGRARR